MRGDPSAAIPGWFDYADFYDAQIARLADGARVVECGTYLGASARYLGEAVRRSGKAIAVTTIDTFAGVPESHFGTSAEWTHADQERYRGPDGSLEGAARAHLAAVAEVVAVVPGDAIAAASAFDDGSIDLVFLDDDHGTEHVLAEIAAWWPKVKAGGVLAGHDFDWPSVSRAVAVWSLQVGRPVENVSVRSWAVTKPASAAWDVPAGARRALVAVCCNERNVPRRTAESLARIGWGGRLTDAAARHGFAAVDFFWSSKRILVADLRDDAIYTALAGGYSHLIFLDADMVWPPDVLDRLLAHHTRGIVSGLYHLKTWPHWPVALTAAEWNAIDQDFDYSYDAAAVHSELLRPEQLVGMGVAIVPLEVCRRFERPWFRYQQNAAGLSTITEDVWFCQHAAAAGCPIWLDPTIVCGHVSQELIGAAHFDRATYEMALLAKGARLERVAAAAEVAEAIDTETAEGIAEARLVAGVLVPA